MSLNTQEIKDLFNLIYCDTYPLGNIDTGETVVQFDKTWQEIIRDDLLPRLERRFELGMFGGRILWLKRGEDPYKGSKPFEIKMIGLEGSNNMTLLVAGQKTDRIVKKWIRKLSKFFKSGVHLIWEEDLE